MRFAKSDDHKQPPSQTTFMSDELEEWYAGACEEGSAGVTKEQLMQEMQNRGIDQVPPQFASMIDNMIDQGDTDGDGLYSLAELEALNTNIEQNMAAAIAQMQGGGMM